MRISNRLIPFQHYLEIVQLFAIERQPYSLGTVPDLKVLVTDACYLCARQHASNEDFDGVKSCCERRWHCGFLTSFKQRLQNFGELSGKHDSRALMRHVDVPRLLFDRFKLCNEKIDKVAEFEHLSFG